MEPRTDTPLTELEARELLTLIRRLVNDAPPEKYLTVKDVQSRLSLSRAQVYNLFNRGELRRTNVGRSVRVLESDLLTFIDRGAR